jgi:hypothetical protein
MKSIRWLRVMLDGGLFQKVSQEKLRRGATWDEVAEEALRLWLKTNA